MAITHGQIQYGSVPTSGNSALLLIVPPGACNLSITNATNVLVYIGVTALGVTTPPTVTQIATLSGTPIPSLGPPLSLDQYPTSRGAQLYVAGTGSPTSGAVGYLLATAGV